MHRRVGKLLAGAAIAVSGTAIAVAVTLPGSAGASDGAETSVGAEERPGGENGDRAADTAARQPAGVVEEEPPVGERGVGRDGLTADELRRVERLALTPGLRSGSEDVEGDRGPEMLGTDLVELKPSEVDDAAPPRRAEVSFYDYKDDRLVLKTVNLSTGEVEKTETREGEQPPPTRAEAVEAVEVLLADPLSAGLKQDYKAATGKALTGPGQLTTTAMIYRVDGENAGPERVRACGEHRCVRLFTKVTDGPWIDVRHLVIDLSAGTVSRIG
ncbi:Tat pathway signal sequence domain protein [Streptomyces fradiae]|uniref:Tat pathway signal sequence domain protein n=3 Tax=Streptomyces TaxID=1883 RepID=A0A3M8EZ99_9ACTN|nr:Tat pathway signal sequence domain protein [Streptomyces fradiae]OFA49516.1 Tat pathway signal sequence domain protein [Streptomyces fradiae]PQM21732.1 Tat pathway signal sequence domain protein [Streptomyces xinghaiensis]RKM93165.1 Tat pathway signal sequence domain protein [Streptomyces xinghaiensis]RNC71237.1 Tat pathway signal sequence domain protein [Streptomyces xinghaiensis]